MRFKFFEGKKKGMVLGGCAMMDGWCMERNKRIFEGAWSEGIYHLWDRVLYLVFLWASVSPVSYIAGLESCCALVSGVLCFQCFTFLFLSCFTCFL